LAATWRPPRRRGSKVLHDNADDQPIAIFIYGDCLDLFRPVVLPTPIFIETKVSPKSLAAELRRKALPAPNGKLNLRLCRVPACVRWHEDGVAWPPLMQKGRHGANRSGARVMTPDAAEPSRRGRRRRRG